MDNFDLRKYLAEGRLFKEEEDKLFEEKKGGFAFWYRSGARGKKNALQARELLTQKGIDADYSKGPYYIDFSKSDAEESVVTQLLQDANLTNYVILRDAEDLAEGRLLKEELTFSFDEYSYEIDDDAYQAEVESGIKRQLPDISDKDLKAIIDSSVEYYYDQRQEDVPSGDIVDMSVDYYNDEMVGDSKPSAPRQKYDLSSVDLSGLDKGQKEAFDKFVDVYLNPYGDTDTQEDLERYVRQFEKVENAYDLDSIIPNSFQYDKKEREAIQFQLRRAYLDDDQPMS